MTNCRFSQPAIWRSLGQQRVPPRPVCFLVSSESRRRKPSARAGVRTSTCARAAAAAPLRRLLRRGHGGGGHCPSRARPRPHRRTARPHATAGAGGGREGEDGTPRRAQPDAGGRQDARRGRSAAPPRAEPLLLRVRSIEPPLGAGPCSNAPRVGRLTAATPPGRSCWGRGLAPSGAVDLVEAGLEEEEVLGEAAELEE